MKLLARSVVVASFFPKLAKFLALLLLLGLATSPSHVQVLPGKHPGYLHALTDLRTSHSLECRQALHYAANTSTWHSSVHDGR